VGTVFAAAPTPRRPRILMVDDQPARLLSYEAILSGLGVECVRALSGLEALQKLLEGDFVIGDWIYRNANSWSRIRAAAEETKLSG
jgi:CheY-like chemotaxis protein